MCVCVYVSSANTQSSSGLERVLCPDQSAAESSLLGQTATNNPRRGKSMQAKGRQFASFNEESLLNSNSWKH